MEFYRSNLKKKIIDLHTHTYMSDGTSSPSEVVKIAKETGLSAISITDHDCIEATYEGEKTAKMLGIEFINGIELTVKYGDCRYMHILGYGMDIHNKDFLTIYNKMIANKIYNVNYIIEKLRERSIFIDKAKLKMKSKKSYIDKYNVFKHLLDEGIEESAQAVWDRCLDPISKELNEGLCVREAIVAIKKAGGVAVLAHFNKKIGLAGYSYQEMEGIINKLVNYGLDGMELYYPSYSKEDVLYVQYIIKKYKLLATGGTDYHGSNRKDIKIGIGKGDLQTPHNIYLNILQKVKR